MFTYKGAFLGTGDHSEEKQIIVKPNNRCVALTVAAYAIACAAITVVTRMAFKEGARAYEATETQVLKDLDLIKEVPIEK